MKSSVLVYVDAPQHLRIAATLIDSLEDRREVVVIGPQAAAADLSHLTQRSFIQIVPIARPSLDRLYRPLRLLLQGLAQIHGLRCCMRSTARTDVAPPHVVVFNDTGIAQRYLIDLANRHRCTTVLVQDGLTETQHREGSPAFVTKIALTRWLLKPIGLGYLGSSRYGTGGAGVVLADGQLAAEFFRSRSPITQVVTTGFLRPGSVTQPPAGVAPHILFWAVDFLGGLQDRNLHELQLDAVTELSSVLGSIAPAVRLRVRLHPGDAPHIDLYRRRLSEHGRVDLVDPSTSPDPFAAGRPLLSLSLQSAGVLDALAARIPSFFLGSAGHRLAPTWTPAMMLMEDAHQCKTLVQQLLVDDQAGPALWRKQTQALQPRVQIPFDAASIRAVLN